MNLFGEDDSGCGFFIGLRRKRAQALAVRRLCQGDNLLFLDGTQDLSLVFVVGVMSFGFRILFLSFVAAKTPSLNDIFHSQMSTSGYKGMRVVTIVLFLDLLLDRIFDNSFELKRCIVKPNGILRKVVLP